MKKGSNFGFTLVEVIVAVAIVILIVAGSISGFVSLRNSQSVEKEATIIKSMAEQARNESISSADNSEYGLHFTDTSVTLFKGDAYFANDSDNQTIFLDDTALTNIGLTDQAVDVVFAQVTGEASASGSLTLTSTTDSSAQATLTIYSSGIIQ